MKSAETIAPWDKISRRLIKQIQISRALQAAHAAVLGLRTPVSSGRKA